MAITKMTSGKHIGEYRVRIQPINRITKKSAKIPVKYAKTKAEAKKIERGMWDKYETGYDYDVSEKPFALGFENFVEQQWKNNRWEYKTYYNWRYSVKVCKQYFFNVKTKNINQNLVGEFARKFVNERNVTIGKDSTIKRILIHMRSYLATLVGTIFKKNPVPERAIDKFFNQSKKTIPIPRYILSDQEITDLKEVIKKEVDFNKVTECVSKLAIWVDLETGMRPQEIQGLKWENFVKKNDYYVFVINDAWNDRTKALNRHLKSRKRGEVRITLPISNELTLYLSKFKKYQERYFSEHKVKHRNDFIFTNLKDYRDVRRDIPVTQTGLNKMLKKLGNKTCINPDSKYKWSLYSLRHTVVTKLGNMSDISYPWQLKD